MKKVDKHTNNFIYRAKRGIVLIEYDIKGEHKRSLYDEGTVRDFDFRTSLKRQGATNIRIQNI